MPAAGQSALQNIQPGTQILQINNARIIDPPTLAQKRFIGV